MKLFGFVSFLFLVAVVSLDATYGTNLVARDLAGDIIKKIESAASCDACQEILVLLKGVALLGDAPFVATLTEVCVLSKAEDEDVCKGAIAREGPIVAHDLRQIDIGSKTANLFCITFLGLCPYPAVSPYKVAFPSSSNPPKARPKPSGKKPLQIVHFSDIHVDPFYETGANTNCTKPICCRPYTPADAPGNNTFPAGPNGDHACDAPKTLEQSMYAAIRKVVPNAAFSIFTGDIPDHAIWLDNRTQNTFDINNAYDAMDGAFKRVYGTAGNHEMSPTNSYQTVAEGTSAQWVYNLLSARWTRWIGSTAAAEVKRIGAYSTIYSNSKLRVISINTNLYYVQNYWLYEKVTEIDPNGQFAWLVSELNAAEKAGERVYIIGHMPMGSSDAFHDPSNYFDQIVNRYSSTIAALFFGHTHVDQFEIAYSNYTAQTAANAQAVSYIVPSMTPTSGYPAFRVYLVDPDTFAVIDSVTYIADMTNPSFQSNPVWTRYYSAKSSYGAYVPIATGAELTAAWWHNVTVAYESNDSAFQGYISRKSRGWNVQNCTGDCKATEICGIRAARAENNCYTPTPGVHLGKRDLESRNPGHLDECGVSVTRQTLSALTKRRDLLQLIAERSLDA